jgi:hypothetical protein
VTKCAHRRVYAAGNALLRGGKKVRRTGSHGMKIIVKLLNH